MFQWGNTSTEQERIAKNVTNLLNIRKNEVCFDRGLGVNINLLDKTQSTINSKLITDIADMISEREPRADLKLDNLIDLNENGEYTYKAVIGIV
jgi:hypothetical protein